MSTDKEKLAGEIDSFCQKLPTHRIWKRYRRSHDLTIKYWMLKGDAQLLGKSLKARFAGGGGNPLRRAENQGKINDFERSLFETQTNVFEAIFALVQVSWEDIKAFTEDISDPCLETERHLFLEIFKEHFDGQLIRAAEGYKFSTKNAIERAKLLRSQMRIYVSQGEEKPLTPKQRHRAGLKTGNDFYWLPFLLGITKSLAKHDSSIKEHYHNVWQQLSNFANVQEEAVLKNKRVSPKCKVKGIKWEDGQFYTGTRGGYEKGFA
ncbi:MAG: hypothetical protein F6K41_04255 [Symploca sp. SIO3E6]|nr:hypothetical protein [Caldora sp. SIO3E6]